MNNNFTVIDAPQRSDGWFAARAGRATGSRAAALLARIKSGEAAARRDYRMQLAVERLTGRPMANDFTSAEMQRGTDLEPVARARYEAETGSLVTETGFLQHNDLLAGCSLDADIDGFTGILEIKCPKSTTHIGYLQDGKMPSDYLPQITHNLWITGAEWADFCSFDDRLPEGLDWFQVRVFARDVDIGGYEKEAIRFLAEVDEMTETLRKLRGSK
jgi:predicted phage-related endonuclease